MFNQLHQFALSFMIEAFSLENAFFSPPRWDREASSSVCQIVSRCCCSTELAKKISCTDVSVLFTLTHIQSHTLPTCTHTGYVVPKREKNNCPFAPPIQDFKLFHTTYYYYSSTNSCTRLWRAAWLSPSCPAPRPLTRPWG